MFQGPNLIGSFDGALALDSPQPYFMAAPVFEPVAEEPEMGKDPINKLSDDHMPCTSCQQYLCGCTRDEDPDPELDPEPLPEITLEQPAPATPDSPLLALFGLKASEDGNVEIDIPVIDIGAEERSGAIPYPAFVALEVEAATTGPEALNHDGSMSLAAELDALDAGIEGDLALAATQGTVNAMASGPSFGGSDGGSGSGPSGASGGGGAAPSGPA